MLSDAEKRKKMLNEPVQLLVCKMAVPTIISMLISALYNMADTYFVGQLDTVSTAAVGLALPLMNVIQAIGFFFGHGSGNYMSRKLGEGDSAASEKMADTSVLLSIVCGALMTAAGVIFLEPLVRLLGATPLLIEDGRSYVSVLLIGVPFIMASFTINNQLRFQGRAYLGMVGMAGGSVLNAALDPLFIYVMDMGVAGAALATIISQIASFIALMVISGRIPFRKPRLSFSAEIVGAVLRFGTPSLFRQGMIGIAAICLNSVAKDFGEPVIAAITVVNKITMVGASIVIGFGQGFQPVCGFNSGAGRHDRVYRTFAFCIKASTAFITVFGAVVFAFAEQLIAVFRDDPEVISSGIPILRFQCVTGVFQGVIIMTNMIMQNLGKTVQSSILALARQGLFFIPLIYILPAALGLTGLQITQSCADLLTGLITLPMTAYTLGMLKRLMNAAEDPPETPRE